MQNEQLETENVRWDLGRFYRGIDDPQLDLDLKLFGEMAKSFYAAYRGRLAEHLAPALTEFSKIGMLANKVMGFLSLKNSLDVNDEAVRAKLSEAEGSFAKVSGEYLEFFKHEIVALDDQTLALLVQNDAVVFRYRPWLMRVRLLKPHLLPEAIEAALTKRSPFGAGAWSEFYDEMEADLRFHFRGEDKTCKEIVHLFNSSGDATVRAEALKVANDGLAGGFAKYAAQTLYMISAEKNLEDEERGFRHPMQSRNTDNMIPDVVVEFIHEAVEKLAGPLARRYYRLKAAHLGLKTLRWSDRNAPMPFADNTMVPFKEAIQIVISAYESFSPILASLVREMYFSGRIDAPATKGKRSGAFNQSFVLPGGEPVSFTLLNYLGSSDDVMTLAHELGHGCHGLLAGETHGVLMSDAPIAFAETASVFGEMTTFDFLKRRLSAPEHNQARLALILEKVNSMMNTVVRQISFSNFERRIHGAGKWLSASELDSIWLETTQAFYGANGEVFTYENASHLWAYIPHFHNPFYVYSYAFGELLAQSLYAEQKRLGSKFEPLYLELLRSGSTKDVVALLQPFGLDPTDPSFWARGIAISLEAMIEEAEQLSRELGLIK